MHACAALSKVGRMSPLLYAIIMVFSSDFPSRYVPFLVQVIYISYAVLSPMALKCILAHNWLQSILRIFIVEILVNYLLSVESQKTTCAR